ncbi:unnamed protein product [Amoebophrya sp. A25]|nr:unnamed protein product [Amoebophrya sp. A25]|eukprot:GSA25T00026060001.1
MPVEPRGWVTADATEAGGPKYLEAVIDTCGSGNSFYRAGPCGLPTSTGGVGGGGVGVPGNETRRSITDPAWSAVPKGNVEPLAPPSTSDPKRDRDKIFWQVVFRSGSDRGDIIVRKTIDLQSDEVEYLFCGEQVEQIGSLQQKLAGVPRMPVRTQKGNTGWVTLDATAKGGPKFFAQVIEEVAEDPGTSSRGHPNTGAEDTARSTDVIDHDVVLGRRGDGSKSNMGGGAGGGREEVHAPSPCDVSAVIDGRGDYHIGVLVGGAEDGGGRRLSVTNNNTTTSSCSSVPALGGSGATSAGAAATTRRDYTSSSNTTTNDHDNCGGGTFGAIVFENISPAQMHHILVAGCGATKSRPSTVTSSSGADVNQVKINRESNRASARTITSTNAIPTSSSSSSSSSNSAPVVEDADRRLTEERLRHELLKAAAKNKNATSTTWYGEEQRYEGWSMLENDDGDASPPCLRSE